MFPQTQNNVKWLQSNTNNDFFMFPINSKPVTVNFPTIQDPGRFPGLSTSWNGERC